MSLFAASHRPCALLFWLALCVPLAHAQDTATIHGAITDPVGAVVRNARVEVLDGGIVIASGMTGEYGEYRIAIAGGRSYQLRVTAPTFAIYVSAAVPIAAGANAEDNVALSFASLAQQVTVTTTGTPTPETQTGAAVTVLSGAGVSDPRTVEQALRLTPGLQLLETGQPGGTVSLFTRGGNADGTKVFVDGIPANDLGGFTEFANLASTGFDRIEVLRVPNSTLYGADALAGVVTLTTMRGDTRLPRITYAVDGGNFGTYQQTGSLGGAWRAFDYFSAYSRFDTANSIPHSQFHNGTYAGNFGWTPRADTDARVTVRHVAAADGNANAYALYEIPDDANQREQETYVGATIEHTQQERWHTLARYAGLRLNGEYVDYAPTGIPYDPEGTGTPIAYLGNTVTLHGANGYSVTGQAIFQYPGIYPSTYLTPSARDLAYAQTDYAFSPHLVGLFAFEYAHERASSTATGGSPQSVDRNNFSYRMQINGDFRNRLFYTLGSGIEDNQVFGVETTPRGSLAYALVRPGSAGTFDGTKLRASFGKGVLEPSLTAQLGSLYGVLAPLPGGSETIAADGIQPIGAQRSRSYELGVDQLLFAGRARVSVSAYHNEFGDQIEFVPAAALPELGVPADVEAQIANTAGGAYLNSQTFRAQGIEIDGEAELPKHFFARAGYSYLDAVIQRSFTSDALSPSVNPLFPNVPIGAYSPLRGARPFRRAPHSGYFSLAYAGQRWSGALTGSLVGRRDDSDFLSDQNFGTTLLLPNRNLDAAYQRVDLHVRYQASHLLTLESSFSNLLNQQTAEAFGYPALPFSFRSGIRLSIGGESWK